MLHCCFSCQGACRSRALAQVFVMTCSLSHSLAVRRHFRRWFMGAGAADLRPLLYDTLRVKISETAPARANRWSPLVKRCCPGESGASDQNDCVDFMQPNLDAFYARPTTRPDVS